MSDSESSDTAHTQHIAAVFKALQHGKLKAPALHGYIEAARMIPLRVDPFINLERVFFAGVPEALSSEDCTREDNYTEAEIATYAVIIKLIPSYAKILSACVKDASLFELFIKEISTAATCSRTNNTATLKSNIASYILPSQRLRLLLKKSWRPLDPETQRGWDEAQCSLLLTPLRLLSTFFEDPIIFMQNVQNGEIKIKAKEFPSFLYPEGTEYIIGNEFDGLLRGPLLVRAFRCIFSGPRSAFNKENRGNKPSQAEKHGMTTVEPRAIAYAAVHTRMALSGLGWTINDGFFNNEMFFDNVVGMFLRQPDSNWAKDTLAWWNSEVSLVRSKKNSKRKELVDDSDGEDDPVSRILAQAAAAEDRAASGELDGGPQLDQAMSSSRGGAAPDAQAQQRGPSVGEEEAEVGAGIQSGQGAPSTTQTPPCTSLPPPPPAPVPPVAATQPRPATPPRISLSPTPPPPTTHALPQPITSQTAQPQPPGPLALPQVTQGISAADNRPPLQDSTAFNLNGKRSELDNLSELSSDEETYQPAKKKPAQEKKKSGPVPRKRGGNSRR